MNDGRYSRAPDRIVSYWITRSDGTIHERHVTRSEGFRELKLQDGLPQDIQLERILGMGEVEPRIGESRPPYKFVVIYPGRRLYTADHMNGWVDDPQKIPERRRPRPW